MNIMDNFKPGKFYCVSFRNDTILNKDLIQLSSKGLKLLACNQENWLALETLSRSARAGTQNEDEDPDIIMKSVYEDTNAGSFGNKSYDVEEITIGGLKSFLEWKYVSNDLKVILGLAKPRIKGRHIAIWKQGTLSVNCELDVETGKLITNDYTVWGDHKDALIFLIGVQTLIEFFEETDTLLRHNVCKKCHEVLWTPACVNCATRDEKFQQEKNEE